MDIRRLSALLDTQVYPGSPRSNTSETQSGTPSFAEALSQALTQTEAVQTTANETAVRLATGSASDLAEVMIASERANLSLGIAVQVRNKLLEAYQDIMRMPL